MDKKSFSYILGSYLGDGYIKITKRGCYLIEISVDKRHPFIAERIKNHLIKVFPKSNPFITFANNDKYGWVLVTCCSKYIKDYFGNFNFHSM